MSRENDSIIEQNRVVEPFVLQAGRGRSERCFREMGKGTVPLAFIHASDMHNSPKHWDRMVEYLNYYRDYLSFAIHTGDYCGGNQSAYTDMYRECRSSVHPVFNCPGNHDCVAQEEDWSRPTDKKAVHQLLYNHTGNWDVQFAKCEYPMSYYKDFAETNIRLIVLDLYYDIWPTRRWLIRLLEEAREKGMHVMTAMHEPTGYIEESFGTKFHILDDYRAVWEKYELDRNEGSFDCRERILFEDILADFIQKGGIYICNLAGHDHCSEFGTTRRGILNVVVPNGCSYDALGESRRVEGTRSYDCFHVVGVDTELGLLKIVRIGDPVDHYFRERKALCFDYRNRKLISDL